MSPPGAGVELRRPAAPSSPWARTGASSALPRWTPTGAARISSVPASGRPLAEEQPGVGRALGRARLEWAVEEGYRAMQFDAVVETNLPRGRAVAVAGLRGRRHARGGLRCTRGSDTGACTSCTGALSRQQRSRVRRCVEGEGGRALGSDALLSPGSGAVIAPRRRGFGPRDRRIAIRQAPSRLRLPLPGQAPHDPAQAQRPDARHRPRRGH